MCTGLSIDLLVHKKLACKKMKIRSFVCWRPCYRVRRKASIQSEDTMVLVVCRGVHSISELCVLGAAVLEKIKKMHNEMN